jgi:hypothetical protein
MPGYSTLLSIIIHTDRRSSVGNFVSTPEEVIYVFVGTWLYLLKRKSVFGKLDRFSWRLPWHHSIPESPA